MISEFDLFYFCDSCLCCSYVVWFNRFRCFPFSLNFVFFLGFQALPNQQTVDYPSFKLVIVGDGGTGKFF